MKLDSMTMLQLSLFSLSSHRYRWIWRKLLLLQFFTPLLSTFPIEVTLGGHPLSVHTLAGSIEAVRPAVHCVAFYFRSTQCFHFLGLEGRYKLQLSIWPITTTRKRKKLLHGVAFPNLNLNDKGASGLHVTNSVSRRSTMNRLTRYWS